MDTEQDGPRGVGGWLALLVAGMVVLGPLLSLGGTFGKIASAEYKYPGLADVAEWSNYKAAVWLVVLVVCAIGIYGGIGLATKRTPDAVSTAKVVLWLGPIAALMGGMLVPAFMLSDVGVVPDAAAAMLPPLIVAMISAGIWTAYLNRSKRVKNTYGVGGTLPQETGSTTVADRREQSGPIPAAARGTPPAPTRPQSVRPSAPPPLATTRTIAVLAPTPIPSDPANVLSESAQDVEDRVYAVIGKELEGTSKDTGAWTKAFAQAGGDDKQTRVLYIKLRFEKLMAAELQRIDADRLAQEEAARRLEQQRQQEEEQRQQQEQERIARMTVPERIRGGYVAKEVAALSASGTGKEFLRECGAGHAQRVINMLKDAPYLVAVTNSEGDTGLFLAVRNRNLPLVQCLLNHGADVDATDSIGLTPRTLAKGMDRPVAEIIKVLETERIRRGEAVDEVKEVVASGRASVFWRLCKTGEIEKVKSLVNESPYIVAAADDDGDTGLHMAVRERRKGLVQFLVDSGASVHAKNKWGQTPLDDARSWNFSAGFEILQRAGQTPTP